MAKEKNDNIVKESVIDRMVNNIRRGDRVIWIVVILLAMISLVAIFSSTSQMAMKLGISRAAIFKSHLTIVAAGMMIIVGCCAVPNIKIFRVLSRWGFLFSLVLLLALVGNLRIGNFIRVSTLNNATRAIRIGGFSLQVYEVVKVAMVMYLAWAIQAYESGKFKFAERLAAVFPTAFGWMKSATGQRWVYIFLPILITTALIFPGSTGSAVLTCGVMFITVLIGGMKWKDLFSAIPIALGGILLLVILHIASSGKIIPRMQTAFNRFGIELPYPDSEIRSKQARSLSQKKVDPSTLEFGSEEFYDYLDEHRQPVAAEIAIVEGGFFGKGPGKSTQKYVVPVMFEDYMFSLIVEEYGLLVSIFIIILYMSLFARGMIIVHLSSNRYAKACLGGLVFLITGQALFHVLVNCNIGIVTGQTLPLISHGRCSFICFCIAFGVILHISVLVNKRMEKEQKKEAKYLETDDIKASMELMENIDSDYEEQYSSYESNN